jgi:ligand-binding SRPBCC domain-containing protein
MNHFRRRFLVKASLQQVAEFHRDPRVLKLLTPPPLIVQYHTIQPLAEGSIADFTMWLGPLPIRWVAVHSEVTPLTGFIDTQLRGPFTTWVHHHSFEIVDENTTAVIDDIQSEYGKHPVWGIASRLMWVTLPVLFAYRGWQTRRILEK